MVCLSSVSGGAVSYLRHLPPLLNRLFQESAEGHQLKFLAHESQNELSALPDSQCIWTHGTRPTGYRRVLWEHLSMSAIVQAEQPDVVFTPYQIGIRFENRRQILMIRNMEPFLCGGYRYSLRSWLRNRLLERASSKCLRRADRIIAVSEFARTQLTDGLGISTDRIRTIYHGRNLDLGADTDRGRDRELLRSIGVNGDYLLTCGSLLPYRRCEDVVAAFDLCANELGPDVQLIIAGASLDKRYERFICKTVEASPHRMRIVMTGHVPPATMAALFRCCAICIIATEIEACPNIAIEAMTAGCAIISSDRPPLGEIFGGCSVEFPSRNVEEMANKIGRLMESADLRSDLRSRALRRVSDFSWGRCAKETYSALVNW